jgi:iron-sulfur cluster assembly accessory protein
MVTLTTKAAEKIKSLSEREAAPWPSLRVSVVAGGCTGHQYRMDLGSPELEGDTVVEIEGARLLVDSASLPLLTGAAVDYEESLMRSGFIINNPNAASTCACGSSFTVAGEPEAMHART